MNELDAAEQILIKLSNDKNNSDATIELALNLLQWDRERKSKEG